MIDVHVGRPGILRRAVTTALAAVLPATLLVTAAATLGTSAEASAASGGTIVVALPALVDIDWFNPLLPAAYNSLYDSWAANLMYMPLFTLNSGGTIDYSLSLAQSVKANAKGTVYTVTLNPKYHWSDGTPVTAQDVLFTWKIIQEASSSAAAAPWPYADSGFGDIPTGVKSIVATGKESFQVTLDAPVNALWFEYNGLSQFYALPEQAWDKYPTNMAKELNYITANGNNPSFFKVVDGAFKMKSAVENDAWTFVPNPTFGGHKAAFSQLILAYQTSDETELNELRTGEVQIGYIDQSQLPDQRELTGDKLVTGYGDGFTRIFLDYGNATAGPALKQLPVREAMEMGVNQPEIIKDILDGYGTVGAGPVPTSQPALLAPSLKTPAYAFNPAAGKALLEKNGWKLVNGVMTKGSEKLSFVMQYASGNPETESIVQLVQSDWAKEGIKITLEPMPFASMVGLHDKSDASKWEIQAGISWDWGGEYPSGEGIFETGAPYNFYQFSDPKLDTLIQASIKPYATTAESIAALKAYEVYVSKDLPVLWMPFSATLDEVATNVKGVNANTLNLFVDEFLPQYWTISQ
jgi:peptide/nickel transport system substrate-binding protein